MPTHHRTRRTPFNMLRTFDRLLHDNALTGTIPPLPNAAGLRDFTASNNKLTGTVRSLLLVKRCY